MQVTVKDVATKPIEGQKTGTSGLRKKTKVFMSDNYLGNWVQSLFNALGDEAKGKELGLGGDGRCVGGWVFLKGGVGWGGGVFAAQHSAMHCKDWVRSLFNALGDEAKGKELGLGGDGRCVGDNAGRGPLQCVGVNMGRVGKCFQGRAVDCIARATFLKDFDGGRGVERGHGGLSLGQSECSFC
jgi:phosphoglucomutase